MPAASVDASPPPSSQEALGGIVRFPLEGGPPVVSGRREVDCGGGVTKQVLLPGSDDPPPSDRCKCFGAPGCTACMRSVPQSRVASNWAADGLFPALHCCLAGPVHYQAWAAETQEEVENTREDKDPVQIIVAQGTRPKHTPAGSAATV